MLFCDYMLRNQLVKMAVQQTVDDKLKRPQFGSRHLTDHDKVFEHNAWDNVIWDKKQEEQAKEMVKENSTVIMDGDDLRIHLDEADQYWNNFYSQHQNKFFKDRHWLFTEFPELLEPIAMIREDDTPTSVEMGGTTGSSRKVLFEVGCGAGNTVFPILQTDCSRDLFIYCCDFSEPAIDLVKAHPSYDTERCCAFVADITDTSVALPMDRESVDILTLIFVLSAIRPQSMEQVVNNLVSYLKPGGLLLFRDYGRYDMAQLRFKKGKCLGDNFYARGDGTMVYFFTEGEVEELLVKAGLIKLQLHTDRRLQVNRGKQLKMYRVWIQSKFQKPVSQKS